MAPEQGPEFKNASCGKTSKPTNELESGQEQSSETQATLSTLQTDSLGWIYLLRKDKLVEVCRQNGITITDRVTVDQLRRQLTELIRLKRQRASSENLLRSLEEELINEERKPISDEPEKLDVPIISNPRTTKSQGNVNDTEVMAIIRRWELTYDGGDNLMEFIERLEELAECYGLEQSRLLFGLLEILRNRALQWYRIKREHIDTWEKFKEEATRFFLPKRHLAHLEESIYHRKQGNRERAKDYIMSLQALIRQHPELKKINHTDRIYDGLRYEYRLYIRRHDFSTLDELMDLAEEYELLRKEEAKQGRPQPNHYLDTTPYNRKTHCWRCREGGHFRRQCPNRGEIFCSRCGRQGILSRNCQCDKSLENVDGRFYMDIWIYGKRIRALVDTGSTLTYIGNEVQTLLESRRVLPRDHQRTVQLADGTCVSSIKVYPITVNANGKPTRILAPALRTLAEPVILGMDFLRRRNVTMTIDGVKLQASVAHNSNPSDPNHSISTREDLTSEQEEKLQGVLSQARSSFEKIQGPCTVGTHVIRMKHHNPIKQRYYPRNPAMQAVLNQEIDDLLKRDRIEPSRSPYSSPVVLVRKKQGTWRMCIDFRQINAAAEPDAYPLPQIHAILDQLRDATFISTIDLKNGYWQIPVEEQSRQYTAFTVPGRGLFQWKVMPFGLHSAPATFQRILDNVIGLDLYPRVFVYLDDIIVLGRTFEEHLNTLQTVFHRLLSANLQINFEKCEFVRTSLKYLGHVVCSEGIHTDPGKVDAVLKLEAPKTIRELRRIIGIASWYRRFIPDFSNITAPMTRLLKKRTPWQWGTEQENAFGTLKLKLTEAPILSQPDFERPFFLQTDASKEGLGAVLFQRYGDQERVIAYASRTLSELERKYSATEQECLAVLWGIRKMRSYLEGYQFTVITDHQSLKWLYKIQSPSGRLARWALELQQYNFDIEYRRGKLNVVADALSRNPIPALATLTTRKRSWYEKAYEKTRTNAERNPDYQILDDRLFRHISKKSSMADTPEWKLCVPPADIPRVLQEIHDAKTAGHLGTHKTLRRAQEHYYWPGMHRDTQRYIKSCDTCRRHKVEQKQKAGFMHTMISGKPWDTVCMDFIGPLPRSTAGQSWLLVFVDKFSKWVEMIPLRTATTQAVIKALRERVIYRFGCPSSIVSDNGPQFISKPFKSFVHEYGMKHILTAPYTPQENPTERVNRVIKTIIAQNTEGNHKKWDQFLPEISFAINSATHESTKHSPAEILFGRNLKPPRQVIHEGRCPIEQKDPNKPPGPKEWQIISEALLNASEKQKKYYNLRRRKWNPRTNEKVYKRDHPISSTANHFASKLAPKFSGPYKIVEKVAENIYRIRADNGRQYRVHVQDLKPYHDRHI